MMKQKLLNLFIRDSLLVHKVGFVLGTTVGVVGGLILSERADRYQTILEEVVENGEEVQD